MKYQKKMTRYERSNFIKEKLKRDLAGSGLYVFQNNTNADLDLPKMPSKIHPNPLLKEDVHPKWGKVVGPKGTFEGDDYFMSMVRTNELRVLRQIESPTSKGANNTVIEKLILDQPQIVTNEGAIEHNIKPSGVQPVRPIHDVTSPTPNPAPVDTLITEDPLGGVDILID